MATRLAMWTCSAPDHDYEDEILPRTVAIFGGIRHLEAMYRCRHCGIIDVCMWEVPA